MTEDIVKKLQLTSERKETLKLNTFGNAEFRSKSYKLVSFNIELKDEQVEVIIIIIIYEYFNRITYQ